MSRSPSQDPLDVGPIGGQALPEGVMMRREVNWAAAVRRLDGTIATTGRTLSPSVKTWRRIPLVRGMVALVETTVLGVRATLWAARERGQDDGSDFSAGGLVTAVLVAFVAVFGIFGLLPAVVVKTMGVRNPLAFSLIEGVLRIVILVAYLAAIGRSARIRRVFGFHGAEHMTIHAFEHGAALEASEIRRFDRRHPRCGTAFLLVVALTSILVHALIGHPSWPVLVASRVLGLPVVAGLAYEAIRFAGRHPSSVVGRLVRAPGEWLQSLTTAPPDDDMIEVAVAALEAVLSLEAQPTDPADLAGAA